MRPRIRQSRAEASHFFRLVSYHYERGATLITTNKAVKDWPEILAGDEAMAAALLDRLFHRCYVLNIRGRSYRLQAMPLKPPIQLLINIQIRLLQPLGKRSILARKTKSVAATQRSSQPEGNDLSNHHESRVNLVLACATLLIAIITLIALVLSRRHSELSVRPYLDATKVLGMEQLMTSIKLSNDGIGPAIIHWAEIRLDGERPQRPGDRNGWPEIWHLVPTPDHPNNEYDFFTRGESITAGGDVTLVGLHNQDVTIKTFRNENVEFLRRLQFVACYCSLYDDCWTFTLRLPAERHTKYAWFGCDNTLAADIPVLTGSELARKADADRFTVEGEPASPTIEGGEPPEALIPESSEETGTEN